MLADKRGSIFFLDEDEDQRKEWSWKSLPKLELFDAVHLGLNSNFGQEPNSKNNLYYLSWF